MKKITLAMLAILLMVLSYGLGRVHEQENNIKDYQVACVLSECCRNMIENIGTDAEEIYYEYVDNLDCDSDLVITREDVDNYSWR